MKSILTTYNWQIKLIVFIAMLISPFGAYLSAINGQSDLTVLFLGVMCLIMLLTTIAG